MIRFIFVLAFFFNWYSAVANVEIEVDIELPNLRVDPYFKPYVAMWLETEDRKPVDTLALWYQVDESTNAKEDGKKWLKDLRQWWRKVGRPKTLSFDGVTGATKKPGHYSIKRTLSPQQVKLSKSRPLILLIEASREEGGRSYQRQVLDLTTSNTQVIAADGELGHIEIEINVSDQKVREEL